MTREDAAKRWACGGLARLSRRTSMRDERERERRVSLDVLDVCVRVHASVCMCARVIGWVDGVGVCQGEGGRGERM